jgi:thiol-disulfide isomerase/thioredoxin
MKTLITLSYILFSLVVMPSAFTVEFPFNENTITYLKNKYQGKKWLMVLWSVECPPCIKELALIESILEKNESLPIVVINTDGDKSLDADRKNLITQFKLDKIETYCFTDGQTDTSRFQVDANWFGELPRSYFFNEQGQSSGRSGLLSKEIIQQWLTIN